MLNYIKKSPHRNQLESYLREYLPKLSGTILDVGSKDRRYDYLMKQKPVAVDISPNEVKGVQAGDINNLSFENGSFENIVCLEVLEYISTPEKAVSELHRVLSDGGTLILSVPFMYKLHGDKLRYTESHLQSLLSEFKSVQIHKIGNAYTIILDIVFGQIKSINIPILRYIATLFYYPFALCIPDKVKRGENYISGFFIIAHK